MSLIRMFYRHAELLQTVGPPTAGIRVSMEAGARARKGEVAEMCVLVGAGWEKS